MIIPILATILAVSLACFFICKNVKHQKIRIQDQEQHHSHSSKSQKSKEQASTITVDSTKTQSKPAKKKKKKELSTSLPAKTNKQLQQIHGDHFYGSISLRSNKHLTTVTALAIKNSKVLVGNSKNELVLYDLKKWKTHTACNQHYYTSLDNNCASAVAISQNFYFACLDFQKTIIYFQFKGEGGVYFKEVKRFQRNIFKSNQGTMHVPDSQKFIVTTGLQSDTSISVWSMEGDKLANIGTYQIQHYGISYTNNLVLVRGWTSQLKAFELHTDKNGSFLKIDKGFHLTLKEKPTASVIDSLGIYACAIIGEGELIKLWDLGDPSHSLQITVDGCQVNIDQPKYCSIATLKMDNQRLKTVVLVANDQKMVLLDRHLKIIKQFEGVAIQEIRCFGASKSAVFGTCSGGKLSVWDLTKLANQQAQYVHP